MSSSRPNAATIYEIIEQKVVMACVAGTIEAGTARQFVFISQLMVKCFRNVILTKKKFKPIFVYA